MTNARELAQWLRENSGEEDVEVTPGVVFRVRPVSRTEIPEGKGNLAIIREVISRGLVAPKVWAGADDDCDYEGGFVPYIKLARFEEALTEAIVRVSGWKKEEAEAVTFRDSAEGGNGDTPTRTVDRAKPARRAPAAVR